HIYVVDRNNLGKFNSGTNAIYQDLPSALSGSVFSTPAWFNGKLYYGAVGDRLKAFTFTAGAFPSAPSSQTAISFVYPGTTPSISANGTSNAIAWAAENAGTAVLHAYDATDLTKELYNSNQAPNGRDHFGSGNKFIVPTVVNGKVYVGTTNGVGVFGLPSSFTLAASPSSQTVLQGGSTSYGVTINPTGGFTGQVTLSVSGLPGGSSGSFSPNPATASSTLAVTTSASTPAGAYTLTITGDGGSQTHTTTVALVVNAPVSPDFMLGASPSSKTVTQGDSTGYN